MYKYIFYFFRSVTMLTLQHICLGKDTSSAGVMSGCRHGKIVQSPHRAAICRLKINVNMRVYVFFFLSRKMQSFAFIWTCDRWVVPRIIIKIGFKLGLV